MKIVGYTYNHGSLQMAMKSDSSLLNQRKPFFLPHSDHTVSATLCVVVRINHLGRHIAEKFAHRYIDAITLGLDFRKETMLQDGWTTEAIAFDDSLAVGDWQDPAMFSIEQWPLAISIPQAIAQISKCMTLRTGDLIYIDTQQDSFFPDKEQVFTQSYQGNEILYCKMK